MPLIKHIFSIVIFITCTFDYSLGQSSGIKKTKIDSFQVHKKHLGDSLNVKKTDDVEMDDINFDWKIWLPTATALIVLLVTNLVTLYKIRKDTKEAIKKELIISKIKFERDRLEKLYDPVYITLRSNSTVFNSYGPQTFPKDGGALETEASQVWRQLVENVIIPNNKKICDTILQFSHLVDTDDSISHYIEYSVHAESYKHFINFPNTLHKAFKYPTGFILHVQTHRNRVLHNLKETENKLIT